MSSEAEMFLALSANRKRLLKWRIVAVIGVALTLMVAFARKAPLNAVPTSRPHIARLVIRGVINNDVDKVVRALGSARESSSVTGLLVVVDSPGGGVTGGERLHDAIEQFAAKKPVAISMGDMGASAAYMLSVPAQHVVALPSTLTGSIGVILQRPDVSPLLGRLGVDMAAVTSGAMKDQTDPTSRLTPEGRAMLQGLVNDLFGQFVGMVAKGRHMSEDNVRKLADGRAYTGRQAISLGLIDELGDENTARAWLRKTLKIGDRDYPVLSLMPKKKSHWSYSLTRKSVLGVLLGEGFLKKLDREFAVSGLDGAVAILQL